ncbi:MAG: hypothetical protein WEB04_10415 [Dehalococcoidia bacterium]
MIPEQYWHILRRWFWLIAIFGIAGAAISINGLPYVLGSASAYDASATVSVAHYVSPTRIVEGTAATEDAIVAEYTTAIAAYATTPQFTDAVQKELRAQHINMPVSAIENGLVVKATPQLFRIEIHGSASSAKTTDALVTAAANAMISYAAEEEKRVVWNLVVNLDQQHDQLVASLQDLSKKRTDLLTKAISNAGAAFSSRPEVERLAGNTALLSTSGGLLNEMRDLLTGVSKVLGDPALVAADVELTTAQQELANVTARAGHVRASHQYGDPLTLLNPTQTVETQAESIATRDLAILGGVAGLVAGWAAANMFDKLRAKRQAEATEPLTAAGPAGDKRLRKLIERSAEVERRARALASNAAIEHDPTPAGAE